MYSTNVKIIPLYCTKNVKDATRIKLQQQSSSLPLNLQPAFVRQTLMKNLQLLQIAPKIDTAIIHLFWVMLATIHKEIY
jgi:hypothetical protein